MTDYSSNASQEESLSVHPGIILEKKISQHRLTIETIATQINLPISVIDDIIKQRSLISAEMSIRLSRYFEMPDRYWFNLTTEYMWTSAARKYSNKVFPKYQRPLLRLRREFNS